MITIEKILNNPSAYVARYNNIDTAKSNLSYKNNFIVKVGNEYWVTNGRCAGLLINAGFEYVK